MEVAEDVSNGVDFSSMFEGATNFNGDLSGWDVRRGTDFTDMFKGANFPCSKAPKGIDNASDETKCLSSN